MKLGGKTLAFILLFVAVVLVTYLASQFPARLDLTGDRLYTLSSGTRNLLGKIEEPLSFKYYFTRSGDSGDVQIQFKNYASRVEVMLRQFSAASRGRIKLAVIDPQPDTDEESAARRAGLSQKQLSSGDSFFFGLVVTQGSEEKTIPFFDAQREPFLEYDVAKLVASVQQIHRPKLGLISSLPLKSGASAMHGQRPAPGQLSVTEWENSFEVVSIEESAADLPADLNLLVVAHPQNLSEKLQYAIDQFLLSGKPVLLAVDPSSYYMRATQQRQQNMMMMQQSQNTVSNLPKLLTAYGITFDPTNVLGDMEGAMVTGSPASPATNPTWMMASAARFNKAAQPTSALKTMWLIEAGSVDIATDRGYEITPLIETSERSGTVPAMMLSFSPPGELAKQFTAGGGKKTVAALVHGTFKSAFPDGAPKGAAPDAEKKDAENLPAPDPKPDAASAPALKESAKPSTLVVIADSDWLLDITSVKRIEQLDAYMPMNDNLAFSTNLADFLAGSADLIAIRGKGRSQRPFEVIEKMEAKAQEQYQSSIEALDKQLNDIQQELNKLVQQQNSTQQLVATPEMKTAIDKYRDQEAAMKTERRSIRRQLRVGIEGLQNRLTALNIIAVPLAIIAVGIVYFVSRQSRRKQA